MKITYLGHSCFKFEKDGFAMIIDPYKAGSVPGYAPLKENANQVLSSHKHADHFGLSEVKLAVTRADTPFMISFIETFHDDKNGALRGCNNVIIVDVDGLRLVHMGDIGCELSDEDIEKIKDCDVLCFSFIWKGVGYAEPMNHRFFWPAVWCKCWRRTAIGDTRFHATFPEDVPFTSAVLQKDILIKYWDNPLYYYNYFREGSISQKLVDEGKEQDFRRVKTAKAD